MTKINTLLRGLHFILSSSMFSWFIIGLFILQAMWVAWTFNWIIFDERFHFGIIKIYTHHWWPVIYDQPLVYDQYRDFAGEGSKLYHFLMSFPLRFVEIFTSDQIFQLRTLRIINIAMGAIGIWWFFRLFKLLKIQLLYSNLALFVFILLPIVPWIGGAVNYDNFIFMLAPIVFYLFISIVQMLPRVQPLRIALFLTLCMLACLAKFTFLPLPFFMILILIVRGIVLVRSKHKLRFVMTSKKQSLSGAFVILVFAMLFVLFIQTYAVNFLKYGTPRPECQKTLGVQRCLSNPVIQRNERLLDERQLTQRRSIVDYSKTWVLTMQKTLLYSSRASGRETLPLPLLSLSLTLMFVIGLVFSSVYIIKRHARNKYLMLLLAICFVYTAIVFFEHYSLYKKYAAPLAIQGRYLLLILPIVMVFFIQSVFDQLRGKLKGVVAIFCTVLLVIGLSQGGGVLTHIVRSKPEFYWSDPYIQNTNTTIKNALQKIIKE